MDNSIQQLEPAADVNAFDSDDILRTKARGSVDTVLRRFGESVAQRAWEDVSRDGEPKGDKSLFIQKSGEEAVTDASTAERQGIENALFDLLKKERDDLASKSN